MILILLPLSNFWLGILNLKNTKNLWSEELMPEKSEKRKSEELMPVVCDIPIDGGTFEGQKIRKKKQNRFLLSNAFNVYNLRVLKSF